MSYDFDRHPGRKKTDSVKYDLAKAIFGSDEVLPMWVADMDFEVPDFIRDAIRERVDHPVYGYTYRPARFYRAVSSWMQRRHGWKVSPGMVGFSPGIVPALNMCVLAFTEPGDRIVVQPPVYFPFFNAVTNHGRVLVHNQLLEEQGKYRIDFDHLEKAFREGVRMCIFCHPHNPVGRVWSGQELETLAGLCQQYDVRVISDEIHSDLLLFGHKHIPLASLNPEIAGRTITCMAPSKTFNLAGLYTSVVIIPDPGMKKEYDRILDAIHVGGGNIFGQVALEAAYTHGEQWLTELNAYLEKNFLLVKEHLEAYAPEIVLSPLEATYLVWMDFSFLNLGKEELKKFIVEEAGLGLNDGPMFGPGGEDHQRMNIATSRAMVQEGVERLTRAVRKAR